MKIFKQLTNWLFIFSLLFGIGWADIADAVNKVRAFTAHIGGGVGALDKVATINMEEGDISIVVSNAIEYVYVWDDNGTDAEDDVNFTFIQPDDFVAAGSSGVWDLVSRAAVGYTGASGTMTGYPTGAEPANATIIKQADVDDTPDNGDTTTPPSANWAYDHENGADPHVMYELESSNNIDPDRLNGDTVNDSHIDVAILGMFSVMAITTVPGDGLFGGITAKTKNAGEDIAQFKIVYLDNTEAEWMLASGAVAVTWANAAFGVAVGCSGGPDWPCQNGEAIEVLKYGVVQNNAWAWTGEGLRVWLDDVAGNFAEDADKPATENYGLCVMGHTMDTDTIWFNPSPDCATVK